MNSEAFTRDDPSFVSPTLTRDELVSVITELRTVNAELEGEVLRLKARIEELEGLLNKPPRNPRNSSVPPSRGEKENKKPGERKVRRKRGFGARRDLCDSPDKIFDVKAGICPHCQRDLSGQKQKLHSVAEKIEVKSETFVTHANLLACDCPYCGRRVVAQRPEGFGEATPFAGSVSALVLLYHYTQSISYGRLCELFSGVYGLRISEGAVRNIIKRAEGAFLSQAEKIEKMIRGSPVVCCDETGSRVSGSKSWEWVFVASDCVLHVLRGKRSREVVEEVMGGHRPGVWVSDLYSAQLGNGERQQVCLAHQIRDVRYAIECGDSVFAPKMMELLSEAVEVGRKRDQFCEQELEGKLGSLHGKLDEILALEPREEEDRKLRRRYMKHRDSLFVFVTNRDVPYTNNVSERAIRMSKTFLKVTNGFRSQWGAQMYAAVRSVINTGKLNGLTALESIVATLEGRSIINPGYSSQHIPS